ncbi:hypothetical protein CAJAP_05527 [Camponotus japonicus]
MATHKSVFFKYECDMQLLGTRRIVDWKVIMLDILIPLDQFLWGLLKLDSESYSYNLATK